MKWRVQHKNGSTRFISSLPSTATKVFDNGETEIYDESADYGVSAKTGRSSHVFQITIPDVVANLLVCRTVYYPSSINLVRPRPLSEYLTPSYRVLQGVWKPCHREGCHGDEDEEVEEEEEDEDEDDEDDEVLSQDSEEEVIPHEEVEEEDDIGVEDEDEDDVDMDEGDHEMDEGEDIFAGGYGSVDEMAGIEK